MKLSLAWIFEHIDGDWTKVDVPFLVDSFNKTTAEIDGFSKISLDLEPLSLVTITKVGKSNLTVHSSEWNNDIEISPRSEIRDGDCCLIKKDGTQFITDDRNPNHISETDLDKVQADYNVDAYSGDLERLKIEAEKLVNNQLKNIVDF